MAKQPLNSLDRFRKQPNRLVLEHHAHCEVPAGCGGVVLRWRNPLAAVHVVVHVYTRLQGEVLLDGKPLEWSRTDQSPGRHLVTVALPEVALHQGLLMFAAGHKPQDYQQTQPTEIREQAFQVLSQEDSTWKYTLEPPDPDWLALSFDDSSWPTLVQCPTPQLAWSDFGAGQSHFCERQGAACLGVPADIGPERGPIWVRRVFEVSAPQFVGTGGKP